MPCCPHARIGTNIIGSLNVDMNNRNSHRVTDIGAILCPHGGVFISITGDVRVLNNNKPETRIGDIEICAKCGGLGMHVSGSVDDDSDQ